MADPVDQATRERVIELRKEGQSFGAIAELTGISKSTVHTILKRAGLNAPNKTRGAQDRSGNTCGRAREAPEDAGPGYEPGAEQPTEQNLQDELTRANTAAGLVRYLRITLDGAEKARKAKEREAKARDGDAERRRSQKAWEEVQYLKLYRDGLKIAADCTGLSKEVPDVIAVDPISKFLEDSLDALLKDKEEGRPPTEFPPGYDEYVASLGKEGNA